MDKRFNSRCAALLLSAWLATATALAFAASTASTAAPAVAPGPAPAPRNASASASASIVMGEPLRLIRGVAVYKAGPGTLLQKDDIIETGNGSAHIEAGPQAIVSLGPRTRVYVLGMATDDRSGTVLVMLEGWIKVLARTARPAAVGMPLMQVSVATGSSVLHAAPGQAELFAEEGEHVAARVDDKGKPGALVKVAGEQYAVVQDVQPIKILPRPAKQFLAGMPPHFRDRLVAVPRAAAQAKAAPLPPKERDVDYADIAPWLKSSLQVRRHFVQRFKPRLQDPAFRSRVEQELGQQADWKAALRPPAAP